MCQANLEEALSQYDEIKECEVWRRHQLERQNSHIDWTTLMG